MISLPTKDDSEWHPQSVLWNKWCAMYGENFVRQEGQKAELWLLSNPDRMKTERGMSRFFNGWLDRAPKPPKQVGVYEGQGMSPQALKELEHLSNTIGKRVM